METSKFGSIDLRDIAKGLIVAVGGAVITVIQATLSAGSLTFNCSAIGSVALAAGMSYLGKNFFTPAKTVSPVP